MRHKGTKAHRRIVLIFCVFATLCLCAFLSWAQVKPDPESNDKELLNLPAWVQMESCISADLRGIWGTGSSNIYVVGYDHPKAQGVILHFDGERWNTMRGGGDNLLHAVWGTSKDNIYAVGYAPYDIAFLKYDGIKWQPLFKQVGPVFLHGIGGNGPSNFYAIGYTQRGGWFILRLGGAKSQPVQLPEVKHTILRGIWGVGNDVFIVGSGGVILHYDGRICQVMESGTKHTLQGIWGTDINNLYAVGEEGTILHFDGKTWTPMKSESTAFLNGIWGKNAKEIYAVGQNGTILKYNGAKWQNINSGSTAFLQAIWGDVTSGEIFTIGVDGTILCYAPTRKVSSLPPSKESIFPEWTEVTLFQDAVIRPHSGTTKTAEVEFPVGKWEKIELSVELVAINDAWDRIFTMSVSHQDGAVELDRSMTDWGYSYAYTRDVTPYGGLLQGKRMVTAKLAGLTCGWRLNAKLIFYPGKPASSADRPAEAPFNIIPLWNWMIMEKNSQATPPVDTSTITKKIEIPGGCSRGEIVLFATGHSPQGRGAEEFGPRRNIHIKYDGQLVDTVSPWRDDPTDAHGTKYPRSGWMPKDKVNHYVIKLPESPLKSGEHKISIEIPGVQRYWVVSAAAVLYKKD